MAREKDPTKQDKPRQENVYSWWLDDDHTDRRGLRVSLALAATLHLVLFAITFPALSKPQHEEPDKKAIFVVQTTRFKPPEIPSEPEKPRLRAKKVPIPDPEPDDPEPFVVEEPLAPDIEFDDYDTDLVMSFPSPPPAPEPEDRLYISGEVDPPERIHYVKPRFTEIARHARIEGYVVLQAVIDKEGSVRDLKVLKPLTMGLSEEAVKAVSQWRYRPSTVGGRPVNVLLTVTVNFRLQ